MARPTKLTPEVRAAVCQALADGLPRAAACARAGVSPSAFYAYLAAARKAARKRKPSAADRNYLEFLESLKKAEAEDLARNVRTIQRAAAERDEVTVKETVEPGGKTTRVTTTRQVFEWQAAAWWLERRYPEEFSANRRDLLQLRRQLAELEKVLASRGLLPPAPPPARPRPNGRRQPAAG